MPSKTAFPSPETLRQPGEKLEGATHVVRKKVKGVHLPEILEGATKNHIYTKAQDEEGNPIMAYIEVPFDPAANQYPKALYHPDWGKVREPQISDFARPGIPADQYEHALKLFNDAHKKWEKGNRIQTCKDAKREAELRKIGWVDYKDLEHLSVVETQTQSDAL